MSRRAVSGGYVCRRCGAPIVWAAEYPAWLDGNRSMFCNPDAPPEVPHQVHDIARPTAP